MAQQLLFFSQCDFKVYTMVTLLEQNSGLRGKNARGLTFTVYNRQSNFYGNRCLEHISKARCRRCHLCIVRQLCKH